MAKESFNWKSLFINDETIKTEESNKIQSPAPAVSTQYNKFPTQVTETFPTNSLTNPFLS